MIMVEIIVYFCNNCILHKQTTINIFEVGAMFFFSVGKFYRKKQIDMKYVKKKTQSNLTLQVFNENFGKI